MVLGGGILYRATSSSVQAILTSTGVSIWEAKDLAPRAITADDDGVFISATDSDGNPVLIGLDGRSGVQIWSAPLPSVSESVITQAGLVIAQDSTSHVTAVDAKSGDLQWQQSIGPDIIQSEKAVPAMMASGDAVIVSSANRVLIALDLQNGTTIWQRERVLASKMALSGDTLGIIEQTAPDYGNTLVAYNATSGLPLWQRTLDDPVNTTSNLTLIGGPNSFGFVSSKLGELESIVETPHATPVGEQEPWMTAPSSSLFPGLIPFSVVFTVNAESGFLQSVSRWTENPDPQTQPEITSLNSSAISIAISESTEPGILVLCQNGRVGWFGGYGATGEKFYEISTKAFTGGAVPFPYELPGISFNLVLVDDTAAYIAMRDGSLIAIEARPIYAGNG